MPKTAKPKIEFDATVLAEQPEITSLINRIMRKGKKNAARKVVFFAFAIVQRQTKEDPASVFDRAIENVAPLLEVRSKRVGGATYQVPMEIKPQRRMSLAMRWLINAAKAKKGKSMAERLAEEIVLASKKEGGAYKKKEDTHRMAEANRAFAHFA